MPPILGLTSIYRLRNDIRGVPTNSDTSSFRHESPIHKHVSKNKSYLPELNSTRSGENVSLKTKTAEKKGHVRKPNESKQAPKSSACSLRVSYDHAGAGNVLRHDNGDGHTLSLRTPAKVTGALPSKRKYPEYSWQLALCRTSKCTAVIRENRQSECQAIPENAVLNRGFKPQSC